MHCSVTEHGMTSLSSQTGVPKNEANLRYFEISPGGLFGPDQDEVTVNRLTTSTNNGTKLECPQIQIQTQIRKLNFKTLKKCKH